MNLADDIAAMPIGDVAAAFKDPRNLAVWGKLAEDIVSIAMPGPEGALACEAISLYVQWVLASGGGTISPDPDPIHDAQTTMGRGGRTA